MDSPQKTRKVFHKSKEPKIMLSMKSKKVIYELYGQIEKIPKIAYKIESLASDEIKPPDYVPKEIQLLLRYPKVGRRAILQIGERRIIVNGIFPLYKETEHFENPIIVDEFFGDAIYKMYIWLSVVSLYARQICSSELQINLYMTSAEKQLPKTLKTAIDTNHANTAFTTSCAPSTEINIFRQEEWFKVFIHETFHSFGLDFSEMDSSLANAKICSIFRVNSDVRLYETYCEMWAEIIHILFYLYLEKEVSLENMPREFLNCIRYEKMFSVFQCVKILRFFGLTYKDLFIESSNTREKYKESTQVLSYYVLKSIAMVYVNDFIEWCVENNTNLLNFDKREETVEKYCAFFESHCKLPKYMEYVKIVENKKHIPKFVENTMRMSVYG